MDIMEELLASQSQKITKLFRGELIEGEVVAISDQEITLDLGSKAEGILPTRDIQNQLKDLKIGDKIKAYVAVVENEYGQAVLSSAQSRESRPKQGFRDSKKSRGIDWSKFTAAQSQKSQLQGVVRETNQGGLIIEVEDSRGFIPYSQLGLEFLGKEMDGLIGQTLTVSVIEVDKSSNKLVFSQKGQSSTAFEELAQTFIVDEVVKGEVVNVSQAGTVVLLAGGVEGFLKASNVDTKYEIGKMMSFLVDGIDKERKRVNLAPFVTTTKGLIYK